MPTGNEPNIQGYYINGKEWDGNPGDIEPAETETEPEVQAVTPASIEITLPKTSEQADYAKRLSEWLLEAAKEICQQFDILTESIRLNLNKTAENLYDRLLYEANDNPRWWHLYKHAKKARTRKKYKRLLMKQLHSKLRPSAR